MDREGRDGPPGRLLEDQKRKKKKQDLTRWPGDDLIVASVRGENLTIIFAGS